MAADFPSLSRRDLFERLSRGHAAGLTVVTPNRRLAQALQWDFDVRQSELDLRAWETIDALPFGAFVERLWEDALYSEQAGALELLLTSAQEQALWEDILHASPLAANFLSVTAAANQCREAWQLCQAWRLPPQLSARSESPLFNEDTLAFLEWSASYEQLTRQRRQIDAARLPDAVIPLLTHQALRRPKTLVLFGFDTLTPQHSSLFAALAGQGVEVLTSHAEPRASQARRLEFTSTKEEAFAAARWARARLEAGDERVRIGIVVPDLAQSRNLVRRTLAAVLQPDSLLPAGLTSDGAKAAPPFDLSLGLPLADYPLVQDALLILRLAGEEMAFNDASRLIRSPFLAASDSEMAVRARFDAWVRERCGVTVTLERLLRFLTMNGAPLAPLLKERFSLLNELRISGLKTAPDWTQAFSEALQVVGFPGERTLDSADYQTIKKWHEALANLATLERVVGKMNFSQALGKLRRMALDTLFQPETADVPIQVLGVLESAGLAFDHLWVMGLTDEAWPLPARPNPFVPIRLQREAGIPYADAAASLERGRRMTRDWLSAAPEVVLSHARMKEDSELAPSPLIAGMDKVGFEALGVPEYDTLRAAIHRAHRLEKITDERGPPLVASAEQAALQNAFPGGTAIFKDQAACPFRAFARYQLNSSPLETPQPGLNAADRGTLLHELFAALWAELKDRTGLMSVDALALEQLLETCAVAAIAKVRRYRADVLEGRFAALEKTRLIALARQWLEIEKNRPDFQVVAIERKQPVSFGGVTVNAKLDRMDAPVSGKDTRKLIVIDYKTGKCAVSAWLGARPDEPQLPMYALGGEETVDAVAFAQLKTGDLRFRGLANAEGLLPGVGLVTKDRSKLAKQYSDWNRVVQGWRAELEALGRGFASGDARVDPKRGDKTCEQCDQHLFCRVAEKGLPDSQEEGDDE